MALKFFYSAENSLTLSETDYSSGDTTGTNTGTTFSGGSAKTGVYGVESAASTLTNILFSATDIWPSAATPANSAGSFAFWLQVVSAVLGNGIIGGFRCSGTTTADRISVEGYTGNAIQITCGTTTGGASIKIPTVADTMPAGAWRFVVGRWDIPNGKLAIEVYSDAGGGTLTQVDAQEQTGLALSTTYLPATAFQNLRLADHSPSEDAPFYCDHFLISDLYSAPLQNNAFITAAANYSESTLTLTSVADGQALYDGMSVQLEGTAFGATQGASTVKVKTADGSPTVTQTPTTWANDIIIFTLESSALPFGNVTVEVTVGAASVSQTAVLVSASGYANSVVNVPWADGTYSIFSGASPAIVDGDLYEYETVSSRSATVEVFSDGTFVINSSFGSHNFDVRVFDQTDETWSDWEVVEVNETGRLLQRVAYNMIDSGTSPYQMVSLNDQAQLPIVDSSLLLDRRLRVQNIQNGNYTFVLSDESKHIYRTSGSAAQVITIPANSSVPFLVGTEITIVNMDVNSVSIAITTDTLYLAGTGSTGNRTLAQYGHAELLKIAPTVWIISGVGIT